MHKKRMYLLGTLTALLVVGLLGAAGAVLKHEPSFFVRGQVAPSAERKQLSGQFVSHFSQLLLDVRVDKGNWAYSFSEAQINSFFEEDFVQYGEAENLRKLHVADPRVVLEDDKIRLAFRYGKGFWSTVVSYDLRVWIVPKEPNVLAVEVLGRRAGALPISSQTIINELAELAARHNVDVTAYRHQGHPVALIRFQADRPRPTAHLQCLKIGPGSLTIAGTSAEAAQQTSHTAKKCLTPSAN